MKKIGVQLLACFLLSMGIARAAEGEFLGGLGGEAGQIAKIGEEGAEGLTNVTHAVTTDPNPTLSNNELPSINSNNQSFTTPKPGEGFNPSLNDSALGSTTEGLQIPKTTPNFEGLDPIVQTPEINNFTEARKGTFFAGDNSITAMQNLEKTTTEEFVVVDKTGIPSQEDLLKESAVGTSSEESIPQNLRQRMDAQSQKLSALNDQISTLGDTIKAANKNIERVTGMVSIDPKGQFLEINTAAFRRGEGAVSELRKLGGTDGLTLEKADVAVTKNGTNYTVKVKGKYTFELANPSTEEQNLLDKFSEGKGGSFKIDKNGRLSFKTEPNPVAVTEFKASVSNLRGELQATQENLASQIAERDRTEFWHQKQYRVAKDGLTKMIKEPLNPDKIIRNIADKVGAVIGKVVSVVEMIFQGVCFGVPSMIYQACMQDAQNTALYRQLTSIIKITDDLWVQIPAQLVSKTNPSGSAVYLYAAVPKNAPAYGNVMSDAFLQTASYYVMYQPGYPWASVAAGSPNASGIWIELRTGFKFMDGGIPYDSENPFAFLLEPITATQVQQTQGSQPTLSVQGYLQSAFASIALNKTTFSYNESLADIIPSEIKPKEKTLEVSAALKELFAPISTNVKNTESNLSTMHVVYPPRLLVPTLNQFRQGIKNVPGFLPSNSTEKVPTVSIKQFVGTGMLNKLLGNASSPNTPAQAYGMLLQAKKESEALVAAQQALAQAMSDYKTTDDQLAQATQTLSAAQNALYNILANIPSGAQGMNPSYDLNAFNIYLYETEDTPIAQFLKKNRFSPLIPAKDYVVFLDSKSNIVPLFLVTIQQAPNGATAVAFDTSHINGSIRYMCSLVSGLTYVYNQNGPGQIKLTNQKPDMTIASQALSNLFSETWVTLYGAGTSAVANNVVNQISSMASYATSLAQEGPFYRTGYWFENVDLAGIINSAPSQKQAIQDLTSGLSGQLMTDPNDASSLQYPFGNPAPLAAAKTWADNIYIYKVYRGTSNGTPNESSTGTDQAEGCFGKNGKDPVYDYVLPLAAGATPGTYQIMPLGLAEVLGINVLSPVQMLVSLVTGQVYDHNYQLLPNPPYVATVIKRDPDFRVMAAQQGEYSVPWQTMGANNTVVTTQVAAVPGLPLSTAYMPTFCNPYNVIVTSALESSSQYAQGKQQLSTAQQNVTTAQQQIETVLKNGNSAPVGALYQVWQNLQDIYSRAGSQGAQTALAQVASQIPSTLQSAMSTWISAKDVLKTSLASLSSTINAVKSALNPPYPAVPKTGDQLLNVPAMYWMYFANYVYASWSASALQVPCVVGQQQASVSVNWLAINPSGNVSAFTNPAGGNYALGQAVPQSFVYDVVKAFMGWQTIQNNTDGIAQIMQAGPFQFTQSILYNVFLTIAPQNYKTGNFFYNIVSIFEPNDLFVVGDMSSSLYGTLANAIQPVGSTTPSTFPALKVSDCNYANHLGMAFYQSANRVIINVTTGDVWIPTPSNVAIQSYASASGYTSKALCNITKVGTLDPQKVLAQVFQNQYATAQSQSVQYYLDQLSTTNPALYTALQGVSSIAAQQAQASLYPFYFAGHTLRLCQEQIDNKSFIYAVVDSADQGYLQASDYWVVSKPPTSAGGSLSPLLAQLSPSTQYMTSLVTYDAYTNTSCQPVYSLLSPVAGTATSNTPLSLFNQFFGQGGAAHLSTASGAGYLAMVPGNNPDLYNRIKNLVTVKNQSFLKATFANAQGATGIVAPPLPTTLVAVPGTYLYQDKTSGKYFVYIPGATSADESYCYDFNASNADPVFDPQTQQFHYTTIQSNANRGVYYVVKSSSQSAFPTSLTSSSTPPLPSTLSFTSAVALSQLTGYACQAMLIKYGVNIDAAGNQTLGLPVFNPPLPMTTADVALPAGSSSATGQGYMKCINSPATTQSASTNGNYVDYYYFNSQSQSYVARRTLSNTVPVVIDATQGKTTTQTITKDFYVDLITGECYHTDGTPYLTDVAVAYYVSPDVTQNPVSNTALDYGNPLFVWGGLDIFGQETQQYVMYQNTALNDQNNGYKIYSIRPYSSSFTTWKPSGAGSTKGTTITYAYILNTDGSYGITQSVNGAASVKISATDMQTLLSNAFKGGAFLLTKSYVMDLDGMPGATASSSTITVDQSCVRPYKYQISFAGNGGVNIVDSFQTTVPNSAPGASQNDYNNPPLDASLQQKLANGIPFCAQLLGSRTYGSGNQNSQLTQGANGVTSLGVNPTVCGVLAQPGAGSSLSTSGLLGITFSGASTSPGLATTNQYFAYYDSYNGTTVSKGLSPAKGQYGTYTSVVSSMEDNALISPYPGLYAGNFTQQLSSSASSYVLSGAPYIRIVPLSGSMSNYATEYQIPSVGVPEYIYRYSYTILSDAVLSQLTSKVKISSSINGCMNLVSVLNIATSQSVAIDPSSQVNPAALGVIATNLKYYTPLEKIVGAPAGRYLYQLNCSAINTNGDLVTATICPFLQSSGTLYVDIVNGIVFESGVLTASDGSKQSVLSPAGYSVNGTLLNIIGQAMGNAIPTTAQATVKIQTPASSAAAVAAALTVTTHS